jgi:hypothetical protein
LKFEHSARSIKSLILLFCYFCLILILKFIISAHIFIIIFSVLIGLPLAFDIGRNKKSGIKISNKEIIWFSGNFKGQIYLSDISCVEFKKRLDLSYRIRLVDQNNNKILLPAEALPRINTLEQTLKLYGIRVVNKKFN